MGKIVFISKETPYQHEKTSTLINMATAALQEGHEVSIFMYMDGVYGPFREQHLEKGKTFSQLFAELIKNGAVISLCSECVKTRGLSKDDLIEGVKIGGIYSGLALPLEEADRIISL
ncbi:MAG: DsrE family protein [Candidatus Helarchaeota archaeon]